MAHAAGILVQTTQHVFVHMPTCWHAKLAVSAFTFEQPEGIGLGHFEICVCGFFFVVCRIV